MRGFLFNLLIGLGIMLIISLSGCGKTTSAHNDESGSDKRDYLLRIQNVSLAPANTSLTTPFTVTFNSLVSAPYFQPNQLTYFWEFGDGATSNAREPNHTYTYKGFFYFSLSVYDPDGRFDRMTGRNPLSITGGNNQPNINSIAASPITANINQDINFSCTASDPDMGETATLTYAWDFGDGENAAVQNPVHKFTKDGLYKITLTVTDQNGAPQKKQILVGIGFYGDNLPPLIDAMDMNPLVANPPCGITFTSHAVDYDGTISSYTWDFGDGSTDTGQNVTHQYNIGGTFLVKLKAQDNAGAITTMEKYLSLGGNVE